MFSEASAAGSRRATFRVGEMFDNGVGVTQNIPAARALLDAAAAGGELDAMNYLGASLSQEREGVAPDFAKAVDLLRRAADAGHPDALANLGTMHYYGFGVPKDIAKAHTLYRQAVARGSALGETLLQINT